MLNKKTNNKVNNFALIIVTYNGSKWIRQCLNSVCSSSIVPHCIVVDNNSSDNTVDIIKQHYHDVELVQLKSNLGFGGANNIGFHQLFLIMEKTIT